MLAGGMNTNAIKEVISRINAGTIYIDAGKAATFVGSLLKAANGSIKADVLHLLNSSAEIVTQQGRIRELVGWVGKSPNENNLPQNVKEELAIITYNLSKKLESHPELIETRLARALLMPPPPLIGLSGQPMSYSDVGAALLQNSPSSYSTNIVEDAYLNKQITPLLIILDKLGLLEKAINIIYH
ncbi:hypothetical protein RHORCCE3_1392 [Rickettsia hoogstraalii str. RCCE3]|nr:hypothetical protein RHORCCE3_1392 [Rickettsia hoogstraalii str. RCCE3]